MTADSDPPAPAVDPVLRRRFLVHLIWLMAVGVLLDLGTKSWADDYLNDPGRPEAGEWWPGIFVLRWTVNTGALFGTMGGRNLAMTALSIVALPVIGWFFWTLPRHSWLSTLALGGILAGTLGNLHDRLVFAGVRDFIYFEWINYPIFNVADIFICVGAGLFALQVLRSGKPTHAATDVSREPSARVES